MIIFILIVISCVLGYLYYENLQRTSILETIYEEKLVYSGNVSQEAELFRSENQKLLDKYNQLKGTSTIVTQEAQQYKTKYQLTNELLEKEKLEKTLRNSYKKGYPNLISGNTLIENLIGGNTTPEDCRNWAKTKGYPMFGHSNNLNSNPAHKNSCWGYTKVQPFISLENDPISVTGCTDYTKDLNKACGDTIVTDDFQITPFVSAQGGDIFTLSNVPLADCKTKCKNDTNCDSFGAVPNGSNFDCSGKGKNRIFERHPTVIQYFKK